MYPGISFRNRENTKMYLSVNFREIKKKKYVFVEAARGLMGAVYHYNIMTTF